MKQKLKPLFADERLQVVKHVADRDKHKKLGAKVSLYCSFYKVQLMMEGKEHENRQHREGDPLK